ncbi:hypothetical protein AVEN_120720-1 [Araneus ventricosus]|uniref:Uncharacterized protein n=1 Tax=Araneus ventricosus TaxID=182803 RepID=A0A4Y2JJZ2_ARAVE|nr:hypothetical protein AVEN_120720-1 [Araneus ventricosus]
MCPACRLRTLTVPHILPVRVRSPRRPVSDPSNGYYLRQDQSKPRSHPSFDPQGHILPRRLLRIIFRSRLPLDPPRYEIRITLGGEKVEGKNKKKKI